MSRVPRLLAALVVYMLGASATAEPTQIRVVWTEDPARSAAVLWTTQSEESSAIRFDVAGHTSAEAYAKRATATVSRPDSDEPQHIHTARLANLTPNSAIHFRVVADGAMSRDYWFRTAPDDGRDFALLYGGDSRSDPEIRRTMNARIRDLVSDDPSILALAHGGDYIAHGASWPQWYRWLEDWQASVGDDGRVLPIIPARGNHEGDGELFNLVFGGPGDAGTEGDWYLTKLGPDVALLTLDSNVSQSGDQRAWLNTSLQALQGTRWIAVNYHRPAYPAVKSPGGALYHWVPLFEQYNVDFVLESDGHVLKRTVPIRAGQPDPTGVVYLGEGGLGVPQRTPDTTRWYLQPPGMAASTHHVQVLRFSDGKVHYTAVDGEGELIDRYEFTPKRQGRRADEPSIRALPVGKPPPPPNPPLFHCTTAAGRGSTPWLLLLVPAALLVARRRRLSALLGCALMTGCLGDLCDVDLDVGGPRIHAVGDSLLWWNSAFCGSVPDTVGRHLGGSVRNEARHSARLTTSDNPIRDQYRSNDWDWVLISGGANDVDGCSCSQTCGPELSSLVSKDGRHGEMARLVHRALDDGAEVAIVGYYHVGPRALYGFADCGDFVDELNDRYALLARAYDHVRFIDTRPVMDPDDTLLYEVDRAHPSLIGSTAIASEVAEALLRPEEE